MLVHQHIGDFSPNKGRNSRRRAPSYVVIPGV